MIERVIARVIDALAAAAGMTLLAMLVVTVGNMLLRAVATPFYGTFEAVGLLAVAVNALALGVTQQRRAHVALDLVMVRARARVQLAVGAFVTLLSLALFVLVARQLVAYGMALRSTGAVSETLRLAFWPVTLVLAVGVAGLALALVDDLVKIARGWRGGHTQDIW